MSYSDFDETDCCEDIFKFRFHRSRYQYSKTVYTPGRSGGGGGSHIKVTGMLVGFFQSDLRGVTSK